VVPLVLVRSDIAILNGACVNKQVGAHKDCAGVCFGNSTLDECGVCYDSSEDVSHLSGMDCAGVCGGKAIVDECGMCVEGTTLHRFNFAKDCAGQCFGGRSADDPYVLIQCHHSVITKRFAQRS
jgi:hypothetical protein